MAAFLYGIGRDSILKGTLNVFSGNLCAMLLAISGGNSSNNYTVNQNNDQYITAIPGYAASGTGSVISGGYNAPMTLASNGTLRSALGVLFISTNSISFPTVPPGPLSIGAMVIWSNSGAFNTSQLLCYWDYLSLGGVQITPNGSSVTFNFSLTAGMFQL
jgi:hypothetical protein